MSARVIIKKYTGKDGDFGTEVSSIGLKRVDTCVPSVYSSEALGGKTIPADDASEAAMYCIYRPDSPECCSYSMESVFKLHLIEAPDVQLSNIRIYPLGEPPRNPHPAHLYIGNSVTYSQPTNSKSKVAVNDIWNYSKEHPFYLTVSGVYGQAPDPALGKTEYVVEYKDCGYGNVVYLDGVRQLLIPVATRSPDHVADDIVITFKNRTFMSKSYPNWAFLEFIDPMTMKPIPNDFIKVTQTAEGPLMSLYVKSSKGNLMQMFPHGLIYKIPAMQDNEYVGTGHRMVWVDLYGVEPILGNPAYVHHRWFEQHKEDFSDEVTETAIPQPYDKPELYYEVEVKCDPTGHPVYYINGMRKPQLTFDIRCNYHFINKSGAEHPMRFIGHERSPMANNIDDVIVDGVVIVNGHTDNEEIFVNPEIVMKNGKQINAYQCVHSPGMGNIVFNYPLFLCGHYNLSRVNGGIYNPLMAGETDYVYLQLEVCGDTDPGYCVPDIAIEYDEN